MPVIYGGYSIRPAPQVRLAKSFETSDDGRYTGTTITATLTGTITAEKTGDTLTPVAINDRLSTVLSKMQTLRDAFSQDGQVFEIQGFDAAPPTKFNAIVDSIDFSEGLWVDTANYTIVVHGEAISGEDVDTPHCEAAAESWTFEENDIPRTWKATHTVSAKGKLLYQPDGTLAQLPWQYARDFVNNLVGIDWATRISGAYNSPLSGQDLAGQSASAPPSTNQWDRHVTETVDERAGTYSVTETWVLNANPYVEQYAISTHRVDEVNLTTKVSVSGTITGLRKTMGINDDKYDAALAGWTTVKMLLVGRCQDAASSVGGNTLNPHPISEGVDHDRYAGTISYQYEFDDREYVNDTYETYTVTPSVSDEDYRTTVRVDGTITGAIYLDDGPSKTIKFTRASLQWDIVRPLLLARAVSDSGVAGLQPFPLQAQVVLNQREGSIQYTYEFDDRIPQNVKHEFTVTRKSSREDGTDHVTIEGTITGLRSANPGTPFGTGAKDERYNNAVAYYGGISGNLLGLASQYVSLQCINPTPMTTSVAYNELSGTVSYSADFTSTVMPLTPGALTEIVTLQDESAVPVIAEVPVFGRPQGPVIQDMNTVTAKKRTMTVEIVMMPPKFGCSLTVSRPTFDITPYVPAGNPVKVTGDVSNWVDRLGRYTRTVSWTYE
jgi:hypothetical protein